jgi:hypothetical protein
MSQDQDFNGDIALIACFASSWTPAMVWRWHADPFGFLRPWNELPTLMGSAPPATPPSTGTGVIRDHPHRSRPYLQREPTRSWHDPILSRYRDSGKSRRGSDQAAPSTRGGPGILARKAANDERNAAWARELFAAVQPLVFSPAAYVNLRVAS